MKLIFFSLLISLSAFTQEVEPTATPTPRHVCEIMKEMRDDLTFEKQLAQLFQLYNLANNPIIYSMPEEKKIVVPQNNLVRLNPENSSKLRNVIYSVGPTAELLEIYRRDGQQAKFDILVAEIKKDETILRQIFKLSKRPVACKEKVEELKFSYEKYIERLQKKQELRIPQQIIEQNLANKILKKVKRKLHMQWEIIEATDLAKLYIELQKDTIANLMIISHGRSNGHIVDSFLNSYPLGFFANLSPALMSVSFYSCHSQKIYQNYHLSEYLSEQKSYHKLRFIFNVANNELFNSDELAPIVGAGAFLEKVDNFIWPVMKGNLKLQVEHSEWYQNFVPKKQCSLVLSNLKVLKGSMGLMLNNYFMGAIHAGTTVTEISFPCSYLDRPENILIVRNLNLLNQGDIEKPYQFPISIKHPEKKYVVKKHSVFLHDDQTYRSSKVSITLE